MGLFFIRIEDESDFNEPFSDPDILTGIMRIQEFLFCPLCALYGADYVSPCFRAAYLWYAGAFSFL
jgi:hypothetical protein